MSEPKGFEAKIWQTRFSKKILDDDERAKRVKGIPKITKEGENMNARTAGTVESYTFIKKVQSMKNALFVIYARDG